MFWNAAALPLTSGLWLPGPYCSKAQQRNSWKLSEMFLYFLTKTLTTKNKTRNPIIQFRYFALIIYLHFYIQTMFTFALQNWDPWIIHLVVWQVYSRQSSLFVQCANLIRQHIKVKGIFKWYQFHTGYTQGLYAAIITFTCLQYEIQLT